MYRPHTSRALTAQRIKPPPIQRSEARRIKLEPHAERCGKNRTDSDRSAADVKRNKSPLVPAVKIPMCTENEVLKILRQIREPAEVMMAVALHVLDTEIRHDGQVLKLCNRRDIREVFPTEQPVHLRLRTPEICDQASIADPFENAFAVL